MAPLRFLLALLALASWARAANSDYAARFETAWRLVDERYWDALHRGLDWQAVREIYEPLALAAESDEAFYEVLEAMYREIGDDHSVFVPPQRVAELRESYGDLPCIGVFSQAEPRHSNVEYRLLEANVGYIRLPELATPGTAQTLRRAVRSLQRQRAEALILDLRGNPGGRLVEMMQAAGVFTSGFLWRAVTRWTLPLPYPALGAVETELPLVVLIDGDVHSAAEGLAGGLQAQGRATVIGTRSAGNVEAVLPFCFRDGSQAWIATGVLAPLHGATWEDRGVEPDIPVPAHEALEAALAYLGRR